ncbi:hypothetical protein [Sporomusa acidovorans]|uniref:PIN domain-containing protein n=1 Tax=Sporomusa acidovorans (strain ATCC 49682 / DSM 3132 / Mol) TaxID=1123286 RepID=A0ABZ3J8N6_SPOA4|nr:hypothetical protein [Sporomusa acidovorans]OZC16142.1 hypothetical protein SPACI_45090 [Sporomusa acidovorans DSM 3132]SDE28972.1 hypothetical protein SAMN04488499_10117 [Sporomusa acidovorans]
MDSNMQKSVVLIVDSSMWMDLYQFGLLEQIGQLPYQLRVPDFVWDELVVPSTEEVEQLGVTIESFDSNEIVAIQKIRAKRSGLSVPDASNIVLGLRCLNHFKVVYLAAHDSKLRKEAEARGLSCKDGLDLLDEMVLAGHVEIVDALKIAPELARGKKSISQPKVNMLIAKWIK